LFSFHSGHILSSKRPRASSGLLIENQKMAMNAQTNPMAIKPIGFSLIINLKDQSLDIAECKCTTLNILSWN
jgi:hypothetical protein